MASVQAPAAVVMVRPHRFCSNPETFSGNMFQTDGSEAVNMEALRAMDGFDKATKRRGIRSMMVRAFDDSGNRETPGHVRPFLCMSKTVQCSGTMR